MRSFPTLFNAEENIRKIVDIVRQIMEGKTNNRGECTLTASVGSTAVTDLRAGAESVVEFMPLTANAAAELAAGTMHVSAQGKQTFTITHVNNAQTDRDFRYVIHG